MSWTRAAARFALAALVCIVPAAAAQGTARASDARATDAVRLGTLAERIAKLHAQIGQGVLAERSRRALAAAIRDFDATLRAVSSATPSAEVRDNYLLLSLLWPEYREWALKAPTRDSARKLRERNEEVAWVAAKGARMLQEHARATTNASALRAAGASLLAQRVAKLHLWRRWEMRDESLARELRESEENLRRALDTLIAARDNTPEIATELQVADNQMRFLAEASRTVDTRSGAARAIEFIAKTGDNIHESMERATRLYQGAGT